MKKIIPSLLLFTFFLMGANAQVTRYVVKLKNKGGSSFTLANPIAYLSQRAIDRRTKYGIALDSTDLPVTPSYIAQIAAVPNVTVLNASKWLNSVSIQTTDAAAITTISGFAFVQSVSGIASRMAIGEENGPGRNKFSLEETIGPVPAGTGLTGKITADYFNYGTASYNEIHLHNGEFLHNIGLRGQGMRIAMLDAGYSNYTGLKPFDSIRINNQVKDSWNFVQRNTNLNVHTHGMECLSTIAANIPGQFIGKAPKADFMLYCTEEDPAENPIEEHNWACGAERADSIGADVISTSLGYTTFDISSMNHTYADMNGNTTMAAIAADLAAKKGLLVFASIGNDGGAAWHYLSTPSDGDSVVAVGAVTATGTVGGFSSYGPSSDNQVKPDVASVGVAALIATPSNTVGAGNGTSFACPNMAGLGTCLWQGFPEFNNMKIVRALQQAGSKVATPDNRVGYGIPDMKAAFSSLLIDFSTASVTINSCTATLNWTSKDVSAMKYEVERKTLNDVDYVKIGTVSAQAGSLLANHSYVFTNDLTPLPAGTISYRIKQIIDTTTASFAAVYTDTVIANLTTSCAPVVPPTYVKVSIQPNPVQGSSVTLVVATPYAVNAMPVLIYDGTGRLVMKLTLSKATGVANYPLSIGRFLPGKYYVKVLNDTKEIGTAEMIKLQ